MRDEPSVAAVYEVRGLPGVDRAEPVLGLTCDMRRGRESRRLAITGLSPDHELTTPLGADPARLEDLFRAIKRMPNAQGLSIRANIRDNIRDTIIRTMSFSITSIIIFAGIIAFGSVLNASLIEIGDRLRDIATFRVLGYKPGQIANIFFRQNMVVFAMGLILALPLGYYLLRLIAYAYDTELMRMYVFITWRSALLMAVLSLLFVLIAQVVVYRQVSRLDWLEGVKVKE